MKAATVHELYNPITTVERVTPKQAMTYLQTIAVQRPLKMNHVRRLAKDMREGKWALNGETIQFDVAGHLINGQHRLHAIVDSGVSCDMLVVRGLPPSAFNTIDTGKKRSGADVLTMAGEQNATLLAAALRVIIVYDIFQSFENAPGLITNADLTEAAPKHPEAREWVQRVNRLRHLIEPGIAAGFLYLFARADREGAITFFEALETGAGLYEGSPILILRERLANNRSSHAKLPRKEVAALLVKAWNEYRAGKKVKSLRWDIARGEAFPKIR